MNRNVNERAYLHPWFPEHPAPVCSVPLPKRMFCRGSNTTDKVLTERRCFSSLFNPGLSPGQSVQFVRLCVTMHFFCILLASNTQTRSSGSAYTPWTTWNTRPAPFCLKCWQIESLQTTLRNFIAWILTTANDIQTLTLARGAQIVLSLQLSLLLTWNINGQLNFSAEIINRNQVEGRRPWQSGWVLQKRCCQYAYLFLTLRKDQYLPRRHESILHHESVSLTAWLFTFLLAGYGLQSCLLSLWKWGGMYVLSNTRHFLKTFTLQREISKTVDSFEECELHKNSRWTGLAL